MSLTINYGAVYCQHRPIVVSMRVTWHLVSVLFLVLSTFLSRAWLIMCVFFFVPCSTNNEWRWSTSCAEYATRQKSRGLMALIVRPRVLHVTTNPSHPTLHLVTTNERTRPESDWKHSKTQNCSYDSYNFLYKRRAKAKSKINSKSMKFKSSNGKTTTWKWNILPALCVSLLSF